jgi:hypothetical protein
VTAPGFLYLSPAILDETWVALGEPDECDEDAELKKRIPDGCRVVGYWEPENLIEYVIDGDFEVDGIRYRSATNHVRPMFSIEEQCTRASFACITPTNPPTEEELDYWVRTGKPLPRKG